MSLADALLKTRQAERVIALARSAPKAWRAGRTTQDGVTTVTTEPMADGPDRTHAELLREHGFDPARYRIVGPVRSTRWTAYLPKEYRKPSASTDTPEEAFTFQAKASRFQVVERPEGELSIDELIAAVEAFGSGERSGAVNAANGGAHVIALGDLQIGKAENPTEDLLTRTLELIHRAAPEIPVPHIHLALLGDCIEGWNSQGGRLRWRTTLTMTEQVRILRRLILKMVEILAPLCDRLTVVSVPGNHDEAGTRDLDTRVDDSWAVEALSMVADALEFNPAFSHVECYVPGPDEQGVVLEVGGTIVAHVHGHTIRPGKHFEWWAGQAFGGQDIGQAALLLQGHMHHFQVSEDGQRKWICAPAVEKASKWWEHKTGTGGTPGILSFDLLDGQVSNLTKHEPRGD